MMGARVLTAAGKVLAGLGDLLLPGVCEACASAEVATGRLCEACNLKLLSLVSLRYCPRCGSTLGPNMGA